MQLRNKAILRPETQESIKSEFELGVGDEVFLKWHLELRGLEHQTCYFNSTVLNVQSAPGANPGQPGELVKPRILLPEGLKLGIIAFRIYVL